MTKRFSSIEEAIAAMPETAENAQAIVDWWIDAKSHVEEIDQQLPKQVEFLIKGLAPPPETVQKWLDSPLSDDLPAAGYEELKAAKTRMSLRNMAMDLNVKLLREKLLLAIRKRSV
jgi:hypothetical protein